MAQIVTSHTVIFMLPGERDYHLKPGRYEAEVDGGGTARIPFRKGDFLCLRAYGYKLVPALKQLAETAE